MNVADEPERQRRYRSRVYLFAHFVWGVQRRAHRLTPELERRIYRKIYSEAERMGCTVYAIGGMPDHVHLVVRMPGRLSPAALMKQVKGASSVLLNEVRPEFSERFDWQDGYGCLSIGQSRDELETVIAYVRRQKEHHANNDLMLDWEETNELVPEDDEINTLRNTVR